MFLALLRSRGATAPRSRVEGCRHRPCRRGRQSCRCLNTSRSVCGAARRLKIAVALPAEACARMLARRVHSKVVGGLLDNIYE
jgi:hypothetical protein